VIGSIIDIDERKKAENELAIKNFQLAKTNEELDRFVYSASHDMRAPLSSLLGLIHLSEKTDRPEEIGTLLQMMKDRIKTMEGFYKGGYRLLAQYAP
jgi:light-regulated signal transduction histidine kinase (bacteriophytochrome)